jgi:truncated hemoglobin YjbI
MPSLLDSLGEDRLGAVIADFYERVFGDLMIGFFFRGLDRRRLAELEVQLIRHVLGGPDTYQGRPLRTAHAGHRIMDGHFARRRQLLVETLADHRVPAAVQAAWLAHTDAQRSQVVASDTESCMSGDAGATSPSAPTARE